jgi:hypothetical protein
MPSLPTPGDVHVNRPLTNIAIAFMQEERNFVAGRVFPTVPVAKQSDSYYIWDRADFHRDEAREVGPGGEAPIGALRLSTDNYNAKVYKFAHLISDQERANQDEVIDLDRTKTEDVMRKLLIRREKDWATKYFTTGVWTGSTTAADLVGGVDFTVWSNYAASDPVTDIRAQIFHMAKLGVNPLRMKLTVGAEVFLKLLDHPKFIERFEQVQASILNEQLMASVLGIGEVVVPMSVNNTAAEGATATMAYIHGKSALLTYSPPAAGIDMPSAGYTFAWTGLTGAQGTGVRMKRFRRDVRDSDQIQGESAWDQKVVSSILGVFFSAAVA